MGAASVTVEMSPPTGPLFDPNPGVGVTFINRPTKKNLLPMKFSETPVATRFHTSGLLKPKASENYVWF